MGMIFIIIRQITNGMCVGHLKNEILNTAGTKYNANS